MKVLALNCGSSSLKFALFDGETRVQGGAVANLGAPGAHSTHAEAVNATLDALPAIDAVGHRLVHGGPRLFAPTLIDGGVLEQLRAALPFAPLHLPSAISGIEAVSARNPRLPQIACFDTAFHRALPEVARRFALPASIEALGVHRYGFHGLSYEWVVSQVGAKGRMVIAHLGSGASMCAVKGGVSIDTTMGLTPAGGFMMGTRTGDLDPGVIFFLLEKMSLVELKKLVERESGLLGVSGSTADMQALLASADPRAAFAVELFCYQARKAAAALVAALGGLDLLVFTGGIGERSEAIRSRICQGLAHLGPFEVRVVAADEERVIARHAGRLLAAA